jgi:hypothetical protein
VAHRLGPRGLGWPRRRLECLEWDRKLECLAEYLGRWCKCAECLYVSEVACCHAASADVFLYVWSLTGLGVGLGLGAGVGFLVG